MRHALKQLSGVYHLENKKPNGDHFHINNQTLSVLECKGAQGAGGQAGADPAPPASMAVQNLQLWFPSRP